MTSTRRLATALALLLGLPFLALHLLVPDFDARTRGFQFTQLGVGLLALAALFYERHRAKRREPLAEPVKRAVGLALGLAAILASFDAYAFCAPSFFHRYDQFHYYLGARYSAELGYERLYRCVALAEDEMGAVAYTSADAIGTGPHRLDLRAEVRAPDWKIRDLSDDVMRPAADALAHPEVCKQHFSPERWGAFKADVAFFRIASDKNYWAAMQGDHGFNPPPVWTVLGHSLAWLHPASTGFQRALAAIDTSLYAGAFVALAWAFGWRVCAVAMIFWGSQGVADAGWTLGAFLRHDWFFLLVLSACLSRKGRHAAAGAAVAYAALLRVFPALVAAGWVVMGATRWLQRRSLTSSQRRTLAGGALAVAILVPVSVYVSAPGAYREFAVHTLGVHDSAVLTNHVGLRVLVSQKPPVAIPFLHVGVGPESGRVEYVKDDKLEDPFAVFDRMRRERYARYRYAAYAIAAFVCALFAWALRRIRSMWVAECLGVTLILVLTQLTNYYASFLVLFAPLTRVKRGLEFPLVGLAVVTQAIALLARHYDEQCWWASALCIAFGMGVTASFGRRPKRWRNRPSA